MAKAKRTPNAAELDLVPIMNLVTILIPFLLMASSFVSLAVIDSTLPAIGEPQEVEEEEEEEDKLTLSVAITGNGYTILGAGGVLDSEEGESGPTVPCTVPGCPTADSYDVKGLARLLNEIKDEYPNEENVILVPDSGTPYEVLVLTMDATREDPDTQVDNKARLLFPYVVIAGGVQ